jgi:hypothetical protein
MKWLCHPFLKFRIAVAEIIDSLGNKQSTIESYDWYRTLKYVHKRARRWCKQIVSVEQL